MEENTKLTLFRDKGGSRNQEENLLKKRSLITRKSDHSTFYTLKHSLKVCTEKFIENYRSLREEGHIHINTYFSL